MKKIILVNASPRKNGNAAVIAEKLSAEIKDAEIKVFNADKDSINYCIACNACKAKETPACIQKDGMGELISKLDACDGMVLLTPIYFDQISGQAKTFVDRLYCFFNPMKPGASAATKRGKKAALIGCCGGGPVEVYGPYLEGVAGRFGVMGADETRTAIFSGVNAPGSIAEREDAMTEISDIAAWLSE